MNNAFTNSDYDIKECDIMEDDNKNILTIKQFSSRTGLSIKVVRRLIKEKKLVYIKTTQKIYINYEKSMQLLWNK